MSHRACLFEKLLDESSSDNDEEFNFAFNQIFQPYSQPICKHCGSVYGHIVKYQDREAGHLRMHRDYLADDPIFGPTDSRGRFVLILLFYFTL